jgi:hypothetical protein
MWWSNPSWLLAVHIAILSSIDFNRFYLNKGKTLYVFPPYLYIERDLLVDLEDYAWLPLTSRCACFSLAAAANASAQLAYRQISPSLSLSHRQRHLCTPDIKMLRAHLLAAALSIHGSHAASPLFLLPPFPPIALHLFGNGSFISSLAPAPVAALGTRCFPLGFLWSVMGGLDTILWVGF